MLICVVLGLQRVWMSSTDWGSKKVVEFYLKSKHKYVMHFLGNCFLTKFGTRRFVLF